MYTATVPTCTAVDKSHKAAEAKRSFGKKKVSLALQRSLKINVKVPRSRGTVIIACFACTPPYTLTI